MENDIQQPQQTPQIKEIPQEQSPQQQKRPKTKWLILLIVIVVIFGGYFAFAYTSNLWPFSTQQQEPEEEQKTEQATNLKSQLVEKTSATVTERLSELGWNETEALAVAEKVRASTVCLGSNPEGCDGTGWVAAPQLVATCGHCVEDVGVGGTVYLRTLNGSEMSAEVLEILPDADIGIIKVTSNLSSLPPPLSTGFASPGDPVIMVGHPSGVGTWVVTLGEVLSVDGWGEGGYLADLSGSSGNSGSAVVNRNGEVIGVLSGVTTQGDNLDPYPFVILLNLEGISKDAATIESGTKMIDMIERYQ